MTVSAAAPLLLLLLLLLLLSLSSELLKTVLRERFVARMWEIKNAYNILFDRPEGKIPPAKPKHRYYEYIYIYIYIYI